MLVTPIDQVNLSLPRTPRVRLPYSSSQRQQRRAPTRRTGGNGGQGGSCCSRLPALRRREERAPVFLCQVKVTFSLRGKRLHDTGIFLKCWSLFPPKEWPEFKAYLTRLGGRCQHRRQRLADLRRERNQRQNETTRSAALYCTVALQRRPQS